MRAITSPLFLIPIMTSKALVLFAHGARDPRWAGPFNRLKSILQGRMPDAVVELAFLELMTPSLPETVDRLANQGIADVTVVPVFLGQGGHVLRDLPVLLDEMRRAHPEVTLKVAQAVGENDQVLNAIAEYCVDAAALPS